MIAGRLAADQAKEPAFAVCIVSCFLQITKGYLFPKIVTVMLSMVFEIYTSEYDVKRSTTFCYKV